MRVSGTEESPHVWMRECVSTIRVPRGWPSPSLLVRYECRGGGVYVGRECFFGIKILSLAPVFFGCLYPICVPYPIAVWTPARRTGGAPLCTPSDEMGYVCNSREGRAVLLAPRYSGDVIRLYKVRRGEDAILRVGETDASLWHVSPRYAGVVRFRAEGRPCAGDLYIGRMLSPG